MHRTAPGGASVGGHEDRRHLLAEGFVKYVAVLTSSGGVYNKWQGWKMRSRMDRESACFPLEYPYPGSRHGGPCGVPNSFVGVGEKAHTLRFTPAYCTVSGLRLPGKLSQHPDLFPAFPAV